MTIACVIPARYNSVRFPGKLLEKAGGKTILQHTFEKANSCSDIDHVFVATDDERIASHIHALGGQVIWTSPSCRNGTERICEALKQETQLQKASLIVNLQGDHPCTEHSTIRAIIENLRADPVAVMSTAVTQIKNEADFFAPQIVKCVFDQQGNALYFSRSPIPYSSWREDLKAYGHIGIYCFRPSFLTGPYLLPSTPLQLTEDLEQLKILEMGYRIKIAIVDEIPLGVDTPQDLIKFEALCRSNTYS